MFRGGAGFFDLDLEVDWAVDLVVDLGGDRGESFNTIFAGEDLGELLDLALLPVRADVEVFLGCSKVTRLVLPLVVRRGAAAAAAAATAAASAAFAVERVRLPAAGRAAGRLEEFEGGSLFLMTTILRAIVKLRIRMMMVTKRRKTRNEKHRRRHYSSVPA